MDASLKKRVLTAVIGLPLIILLLLCPRWVIVLTVIVASLISSYEYFNAVGISEFKNLSIIGYLGAIIIPFGFLVSSMTALIFVYVYITVLFIIMMAGNKKPTLVQVALLIAGLLYIPYFLSHIIFIRSMEFGNVYIWLVFIGAFMTDSAAYFSGTLIGGRKLCPSISPKKTVAGAIGGLLGCGVGFLIFGLIVNGFLGDYLLGANRLSLWWLFVLGAITGVVSEIGDLIASVIKRQFGIKDFGNILPGHGGILDRCDSIIMVSPVIYIFIECIGILV